MRSHTGFILAAVFCFLYTLIELKSFANLQMDFETFEDHIPLVNTTSTTQTQNTKGTATETITTDNKINNNNAVFKRYEKVVIATKIHGPHQWKLVRQSMCLLHFAYNHRVHYDIVVFTADASLDEKEFERLQEMISPVNITIVKDNIGFQEEIMALTPAKRDLFLRRCHVTDPVNLTWWSECQDYPGEGGDMRLAYNWQAEFRSVRIWNHPALESYKYMMWIDSDGFPSREWENDPMAYFIENNGVIMFENFPQGGVRDKKTLNRIRHSFNGTTVCDLALNEEEGCLQRKLINQTNAEAVKCNYKRIPMIHGFMHITDLDFYRQPKVLNGLNKLLGDCYLCRRPDDQLAVTIPAAIYAPEKSFDMRSHGFNLGVFHNFHLDGHEKTSPPGFVKYWNQIASKKFTSAANVCPVTEMTR